MDSRRLAPTPITTDSSSQFAGRFISLTVKFQSYDNNGKIMKETKFKCALTSVYHPCHDDEHELFNDCLSSLLSKIATKTEVLVGKDVNARIGI